MNRLNLFVSENLQITVSIKTLFLRSVFRSCNTMEGQSNFEPLPSDAQIINVTSTDTTWVVQVPLEEHLLLAQHKVDDLKSKVDSLKAELRTAEEALKREEATMYKLKMSTPEEQRRSCQVVTFSGCLLTILIVFIVLGATGTLH